MTRTRPWLYLAPVAALMTTWVFAPLLAVVGLSVTDWNLIGDERNFVGLDNYRQLLGRPEFSRAIRNTIVYTLGLVPLVGVAPLAAAILVWRHTGRGSSIYRTLIFLPVMIAPAVGALTWQWLLHARTGLVNRVIGWFGVAPVDWLGSPRTAIWSIIVITSWKLFGLSFILYTAGLSTIDQRVLEAATVDGAGSWAITRRIVVPLVSPTIALVGLLCLVFAGQWSFANVAVLTGGGPRGSTDNVFHLLYTEAFRYFDAGSAAALAVLLLIAFGGLAAAQWRLGNRFATHTT